MTVFKADNNQECIDITNDTASQKIVFTKLDNGLRKVISMSCNSHVMLQGEDITTILV